MAIVEVGNLSKRFGKVLAVDGLSFELREGAVTGFLGRNGAGKSTTLRMILGLAKPTAGTALVQGKPYRDLADPLRHVGAVVETPTFHPGRRARDHLRVVAESAGIPFSRVDQSLSEAGLADAAHRRVGGFSLGMRQRLGLATALLGDPGLLILDEPTNGLDPPGVQWLRQFLRARADRGYTVLVSSHLLAEVELSVDEVIIINSGRLVTHSSLDDLIAGDGQRVRLRSPQIEGLRAALAERGIDTQVTDPQTIVASASPDEVGRTVAEAGIILHEMVPDRSHLEDLFLKLTEEATR